MRYYSDYQPCFSFYVMIYTIVILNLASVNLLTCGDVELNPGPDPASHTNCLPVCCRLCGSQVNINTSRSKLEPKVRRLILDVLKLDVNEDASGKFPEHICQPCYGKLMRFVARKKRTSSARRGDMILGIQLMDFSDGICSVCGNPFRKTKLLHLAEKLKGVMNNLFCLLSPDKSMLRVFNLSVYGQVLVNLEISDQFSSLTVDGREYHQDQGEIDVEKIKGYFGKTVCNGNTDFSDIIQDNTGPFGHIPQYLSPTSVYCQNSKTVRHVKCQLLLESGNRCKYCEDLRMNLCKQRKRNSSGVLSDSRNVRFMTHNHMIEKSKRQQQQKMSLKRNVYRLKNKVKSMFGREASFLNARQATSMQNVFAEAEPFIKDALPKGSAAELLFQQQKESLMKDKQMRWHPAIIKWCVALHAKSASSYEFLRSTGFLKLPAVSTLKKYTEYAAPGAGISREHILRIKEDYGICDANDVKAEVSLLFDEMKIKSGLCFSTKTGTITGFTDVGSIDNEIRKFEKRCTKEAEPELATHVMVIMIRGLFTNLHVPIGYYPTTCCRSNELMNIIWAAIEVVEIHGFNVWALVSDGASMNRKFYRLHGDGNLSYFTVHRMTTEHPLFFICDVPHLLKTLRNNVESSGKGRTRQLHYKKKDINWTHLSDVYKWDQSLEGDRPGMRMLHKLSLEHFSLTPSSKMRVYLAAQVLSGSMADAIEVYAEEKGSSEFDSTVYMIKMVNKWFDCMNVSNSWKGKRSRNENLLPYKTADDPRFKWLKDDFLGFLAEWENEVQTMSNVTAATKKKLILSRPTLDGLKITVNSFVDMAKIFLTQRLPDGTRRIEFFLSEKINQDALENYFSIQRSCLGKWDNPTVKQFGHNFQSLYVARECMKASKRSNSQSVEFEYDGLLNSKPLFPGDRSFTIFYDTSILNFNCDLSARWIPESGNTRSPVPDSANTNVKYNSSEDIYTFIFQSAEACGIPATVKPFEPNRGSGLSTGSILLLIFFPTVALYFLLGIILNKLGGAHGKELVPNYEFWNSLPGLIADGVVFTWSMITCQGSKGVSGYDSI